MRRGVCQSQGREKKSFIFALQRFFPLLRGVIRVVICTNHLLSDTLPSLAQSQYCIDGPPKSITSSLQTNKGSNQHANLLGKAWHAKKQFTTFFAKIKQKLGTVPSTHCRILPKIWPFLPCFSRRRNWRVIFKVFQSNFDFAWFNSSSRSLVWENE